MFKSNFITCGLLSLIISLIASAEPAPRIWNETGIAIRQGWHIEWQRTGETVENGNVIYVWSDTRTGGRDLYAQKISTTGQSLWDDDGVIVSNFKGRQEDPGIIDNGFGDYIFIWNDFRDDTAKGDLYAQKLDMNGNQLWDSDGVLLSTGDFDTPGVFRMVPDGTGGAIVLWNDLRNGDVGDIYATRVASDGSRPNPWPESGLAITTEPAGQRSLTVDSDGNGGAIIAWRDDQVRLSGIDIFIQKVTREATLAWNNGNPLPVCQASGEQLSPKLCPDGSGGAYIVWQDQRNDNNYDLYFHHILNDGTKQFTETDGKVLYDDPTELKKQENPRIIADGSGNALVLWEDGRNDDYSNDIYVQKVNSNGNLLWNVSGVPVCNNPANQIQARLNGDGNGGAVAVWMDERDGNESNHNIFAQKINPNGSMAWTTDGVPVCLASGLQSSPLVRAFSDYTLICWGDVRNGSLGIWYQRLNSSGTGTLQADGDTLIWGISNNAENVKLVNNGLGSTFVFFQDARNSSQGAQIYAQLIDTLGNVQFAADGIQICPNPVFNIEKGQVEVDACTDGGNGAIVVWQDMRDSNPAYSIYAQKVLSDGSLPWGNDGERVSPSSSEQSRKQIVSDGMGGAIIVWDEKGPYPNLDIITKGARINQSGNTLWSRTIIDSTLTTNDELECLLPDGSSGAYVCSKTTYQLDPLNPTLFISRVDESGNLVWDPDVIVLCDAPGKQINCTVVGLNDNSAVFVWQDGRNGLQNQDIYAQRVALNGDILWSANGVVICDEAQQQSFPSISTDGSGNIFITWTDNRDGINLDVYIQKLDSNGQLLYPAGGLPVSTAEFSQNQPFIASDEDGGNYVVWADYRSRPHSDIYGIHFTSDGQFPSIGGWTQNGNIVNDNYHLQSNPLAISDYTNGIIVVWEDKLSSGKENVINIYAQRINSFSPNSTDPEIIVKPPSEFVLYAPYPNPFNPSIHISYDLKQAAFTKLSIYDIMGRLVDTIVDKWEHQGRKEITWSSEQFASGTYFLRLEIEDQAVQQKMILVK